VRLAGSLPQEQLQTEIERTLDLFTGGAFQEPTSQSARSA
jgi:hypothetical protein